MSYLAFREYLALLQGRKAPGLVIDPGWNVWLDTDYRGMEMSSTLP